MIKVIVPILILLVLVVAKKIPKIGGNVALALALAGLTALIMGGVYNPISWLAAWVDGLDRLAWVIALSLAGSFYGETQGKIGALDTVVHLFRSLFGKSPHGLVVAVVIAIAVGGEAFGDAIASASVIGVLVIPALVGLGMTGEQIAATILFGCMLGSIMPPISQAVYLSCSLLNIGTDTAINWTFLTVGITMVVCTIWAAFRFVKVKKLDPEFLPTQTPGQIIAEGWKGLLPLFLIVILIFLNSVFGINVIATLLGPVYTFLAGVPVVSGLTNSIVLVLIVASLVTFLFKDVRDSAKEICVEALKGVSTSVTIQACAGLFVGALYMGGQIDAVTEFALGLNDHVIKIGGGISLLLIGMLTGSQTTAQNIIFSFFGPILVQLGVSPDFAAIAGSHLASAAPTLPPSNLTAFVVASMVGSTLGKKVDPLKTMVECLPAAICLALIGFAFMYV